VPGIDRVDRATYDEMHRACAIGAAATALLRSVRDEPDVPDQNRYPSASPADRHAPPTTRPFQPQRCSDATLPTALPNRLFAPVPVLGLSPPNTLEEFTVTHARPDTDAQDSWPTHPGPARLDNPGEFIAALPAMLGFLPERSCAVAVLCAVDGGPGRAVVDLVVRFDLYDPETGHAADAATIAAAAARICARPEVVGVLAVVIDEAARMPESVPPYGIGSSRIWNAGSPRRTCRSGGRGLLRPSPPGSPGGACALRRTVDMYLIPPLPSWPSGECSAGARVAPAPEATSPHW
jgi:hypothetical protein